MGRGGIFVIGGVYVLGRRFMAVGTSYVLNAATGTCEAATRTMFREHVVRISLATVTKVVAERSDDSGRIRLVCADGRPVPPDGAYYTDWDDLEADADRIRAMIKGTPV